MDTVRFARRTAMAGLLVVASVVAASGAVVAAGDGASLQDARTQLDAVEGILQRIDAFLETIADLLRTIRAISGEGGGGGEYIGGQN